MAAAAALFLTACSSSVPLAGTDLQAAVAGQTVCYDADTCQFFATDGRVGTTETDAPARRWQREGDRICMTATDPKPSRACFTVERQSDGTLVWHGDSGASSAPGEPAPGNPRNL